MCENNLLVFGSVGSSEAGVQSASDSGGEAAVPVSSSGKEAPLVAERRRVSGQYRYCGPARHFRGGDDLGAELSKYGER